MSLCVHVHVDQHLVCIMIVGNVFCPSLSNKPVEMLQFLLTHGLELNATFGQGKRFVPPYSSAVLHIDQV